MHANCSNLPPMTETESKVCLALSFTVWGLCLWVLCDLLKSVLKSGNHKYVLNTATVSSL